MSPVHFWVYFLLDITMVFSSFVDPASSTKDETAHYLICPVWVGIISQACGLDQLPSLHELILGRDINDITGALACAIGYHICHSFKLGRMQEILKAIENSMSSYIRAYACSTAEAFMNDSDIQSNGFIVACGRQFDRQRARPLINSNYQAVFYFHLQGTSSLDTQT